MSDFEDKLNKLLNDPKEMERFAGFAKSLMSGGGRSSKDEKLLEAMKPYLSERRRSKMDRAMKIARLAGLAELAAGEFGGSDDGDV